MNHSEPSDDHFRRNQNKNKKKNKNIARFDDVRAKSVRAKLKKEHTALVRRLAITYYKPRGKKTKKSKESHQIDALNALHHIDEPDEDHFRRTRVRNKNIANEKKHNATMDRIVRKKRKATRRQVPMLLPSDPYEDHFKHNVRNKNISILSGVSNAVAKRIEKEHRATIAKIQRLYVHPKSKKKKRKISKPRQKAKRNPRKLVVKDILGTFIVNNGKTKAKFGLTRLCAVIRQAAKSKVWRYAGKTSPQKALNAKSACMKNRK